MAKATVRQSKESVKVAETTMCAIENDPIQFFRRHEQITMWIENLWNVLAIVSHRPETKYI